MFDIEDLSQAGGFRLTWITTVSVQGSFLNRKLFYTVVIVEISKFPR